MGDIIKTESLERAIAVLLRRRAKKTQVDIAKAMGVDDQTVSNWEVGRRAMRLTPTEMLKYCHLVSCTLEQLSAEYETVEQLPR